MDRPDEKLFEQHSEHFETIDSLLDAFCLRQGFTLNKNLHRTPCRVLREQGNPELVIDFYQEGNWLDMEYRNNLPHTLAIAGYFEPTEIVGYRLKLEQVLVEQATFNEISAKLSDYLNTALSILRTWTPEFFESEGIQVEDLRKLSRG